MSLLEDYIKDLNRLESAREGNKKFRRIRSIDFVKGFAICLIVLAHSSGSWVDYEWRWMYGLLFAILDVFGPSLFIFLSAISVIFSLRKKMGFIPKKSIRNAVFLRGVIIMFLGVLYNLFSVQNVPFPLNLWGWNILMFIGVSQIICYFALKFSRGARIGIGIMAVYITPPLREFLFLQKDNNPIVWIFHYIIVSPAPHITFFPYVALCFFSTIFGEMFFEAMLLETREAYMEAFRSFLKYGIIFVIIGIGLTILGGNMALQTEDVVFSEYNFIELLDIMRNQSFFKVSGFPRFLLRGTSENLFYSLGMALIILGISYYYIDIKKKDNSFIKMLIFYGKTSLTIFFIHYIGLLFYFRFLNIIIFWFVWVAYIGFFGLLLYLWNKFAGGKFTFEWFMVQMKGKNRKSAKNG